MIKNRATKFVTIGMIDTFDNDTCDACHAMINLIKPSLSLMPGSWWQWLLVALGSVYYLALVLYLTAFLLLALGVKAAGRLPVGSGWEWKYTEKIQISFTPMT